jgi:hypothetical protein
MKKLLVMLSLLIPMTAFADWHTGTMTVLGFGYGGNTPVVLGISGVTKTTCTCYPNWPVNLCLSRARQDFKEVYAFLLKARAVREPVKINIDETTCEVLAVYEDN